MNQNSRKSSKKGLRSIKKSIADKNIHKNTNSIAYKTLSSTNGNFTKDIKNYMTTQPFQHTSNTYKNYPISRHMQSTDNETVSNDFAPQNAENHEIISSLKALNKRSTDTRNSPKGSLAR
jgi:hypothetical protein